MIFPQGTTDHPLNKPGKREILVSVWDLGATHPQSERGHYVCNDHPAKMRPSLARAILQLYGESPALDPMAGVGTTMVEAIRLGLDAVGIEYEKKFVKQANANIRHVGKTLSSGCLGKAICIQGDARDLSGLHDKAGSVLFSPPYFDAMERTVPSKVEALRKYSNSVRRSKGISGKPISKSLALSSLGYGFSKKNIGNIQKFGTIVFSPPYFDALSLTKGGGSQSSILHEESTRELQMNRSGPFAAKKNLPNPYSSKKENIGNIQEFGSIILSPPYEGALNASKHVGGIVSRDSQLAKTARYSTSKGNIGNDVGRSYLSEMLKVYQECYSVLKSGKFMVVVVKDIQRNWCTIPLGADTIRLCQMAGFEVHDIIINKMYFPSFWMLSLAKKSQTGANKGTRRFHALKSHEYVLVFRKPCK